MLRTLSLAASTSLPGPGLCACPQDVLAVNKSVTALVEAVTQNQMLLKNKLAQKPLSLSRTRMPFST